MSLVDICGPIEDGQGSEDVDLPSCLRPILVLKVSEDQGTRLGDLVFCSRVVVLGASQWQGSVVADLLLRKPSSWQRLLNRKLWSSLPRTQA